MEGNNNSWYKYSLTPAPHITAVIIHLGQQKDNMR